MVDELDIVAVQCEGLAARLPEAALLAMLSANSNFVQLITECPPSLQGTRPRRTRETFLQNSSNGSTLNNYLC